MGDDLMSASFGGSSVGSSTALPLAGLQDSVQKCMTSIEHVLGALSKQVTLYFDRIDDIDMAVRAAQSTLAEMGVPPSERVMGIQREGVAHGEKPTLVTGKGTSASTFPSRTSSGA